MFLGSVGQGEGGGRGSRLLHVCWVREIKVCKQALQVQLRKGCTWAVAGRYGEGQPPITCSGWGEGHQSLQSLAMCS